MSDGSPFIAQFDEHADYGIAYARVFTYLDEAGDPIDVSGYTAALKIRRNYSSDVLLSLTGVTDADGTVSFSSTAAQMKFDTSAQYTPIDCVYDVVLTIAGNATIKLVRGSFTLHPTATV